MVSGIGTCSIVGRGEHTNAGAELEIISDDTLRFEDLTHETQIRMLVHALKFQLDYLRDLYWIIDVETVWDAIEIEHGEEVADALEREIRVFDENYPLSEWRLDVWLRDLNEE